MADSSNTGSKFLIVGAVLGIGAAAAGYFATQSCNPEPINTRMSGGKLPDLTQKAEALKTDALAERALVDVAPQDAVVPNLAAEGGSVPRYTPLFFAPKLWHVTSDGKSEVRDLLNPKSESVYASVPNEVFFKYGLEHLIGAVDALEQDEDGDGFTNGEELAAGTHPADRKHFPGFADGAEVKMVAVARKASSYTLSLGSMFPHTGEIDISVFRGKGASRETTRMDQARGLQEGAVFGLNRAEAKPGAFANDRFKILSTKGEDAAGKFIEVEDSFSKVSAQRVFKLHAGSKDEQMHAVDDITVTFRMTAGAEKDKELPAPVQLGETFQVPGFPGVSCTLVKATPKDIRVMVGDKEFKVLFEKKSAK